MTNQLLNVTCDNITKMEVYCTRPRCPRPKNYFADLDNVTTLRSIQQKYCTSCGMPLLLDGRYLPIKLLGKGGFGAAFLASDRRIPGMPLCVVKQFQPSGNLTTSQLQLAQQLFEREAEVLADVGNAHDQIPDLFAFFPVAVQGLQPGQQEQFFYLVQEYIDGQNLEEELIQNGNFSQAQCLEILREILPILKFIHERHIIHRDIKPSNIMRRQDGRLFLLDFGAVKQIANSPSSSNVSTGIYSMGFAPPEQMTGGQVFPSTDLYALGVTLITLMTGMEAVELFDAYSNQWKWRSYTTVNPPLADILDTMLLPAANQRFQSAQEVLEALSTPSVPPTPTPIPTPQKPIKPTFPVWELLAGAAFSGFEGALIAIALFSLIKNPFLTFGITCIILGGLIFAQTKRWIERFDLLIIPTVSFAIIFFIPFLQFGLAIEQIFFLTVAAALIATSITALFRLIYKLLSLVM